ncbi:MAG: hypothetical protein CVU51_06590 [Deltaproteobacteria bacterium HGW-Deltaproteobacteria-1]|jgi:hypothetical protein|nr:MAG: hypothetical protein CVU51_06590 [Deltaproteobacteria bacterium HGW-Deltaproteobacteria-1]
MDDVFQRAQFKLSYRIMMEMSKGKYTGLSMPVITDYHIPEPDKYKGASMKIIIATCMVFIISRLWTFL